MRCASRKEMAPYCNKRFVSEKSPELEGKNIVYIFDSDDKFELTYDELVEIIGKARLAGSQLISAATNILINIRPSKEGRITILE